MLRGTGLGDAVLVVTRYFGGTKLGTGGLVKAYGDAAKAVLLDLPRAEKIAYLPLTVVLPYPAYDAARRLVSACGGHVREETFGADVTLRLDVPAGRVEELTRGLADASAGRARVA